jgi:histone H3/H4
MDVLINRMAEAEIEESIETSEADSSSSMKEEEEVSSSESENDSVKSIGESSSKSTADSGVIDSDDDVDSNEVNRKRKRPEHWIKEVEHYQNSTKLLVRKLPFQRLVREIACDYKSDVRFTTSSLDALQVATEEHVVKVLHTAQLMAIHAGRDTIMPEDLKLVMQVLKVFNEGI